MFTRRTRSTPSRRTVAASSKAALYRQLFLGSLLIILLTLCGWGIWEVTRLPSFSISSIEVSGGETITHDLVRARVDDALRGRYALLVPYRFSFLYPHDAIVASVLSEPRIESVVVEKKSPTTLSVTFTEYEPAALWCGGRDDESLCYFLDEEGYGFAPAPVLQGGAFIRYILETEPVPSERYMIDVARYDRARTIVSFIESQLSFRITDVVFTKDDDEQYWLYGGSSIRVAHDTSPEMVIADLQSLLSSKEFSHLEPGKFAYIDLRFDNKVFVNEVATTELSASTTATSSAEGVVTATPPLLD